MDQLTFNKLILEQFEGLQERVENLEMLEPQFSALQHKCDFFEQMITGIMQALGDLDQRTKHLRED